MSANSRTMTVRPAARLRGVVKAPASKSYTHRALLIAALGGRSTIVNPLNCDDTRHTAVMCRRLGAGIRKLGNAYIVHGVSGQPRLSARTVNVGEAGTLLRFILSILALAKGRITVTGKGSLLNRPNRQVVDVLSSWGVAIRGRGSEHRLPIRIDARGVLRGGRATVEGSVTSQVVSSLLIAAPFAQETTALHLACRLVSRPYVDITIDVLKLAGIRVERSGYRRFKVVKGQRIAAEAGFVVHGDYSSAAFLLAAAALTDSLVTVSDLVADRQGDRRIVPILRAMGAAIVRRRDAVTVRGPARLRGVELDGSDIPDLVPILATLGCFASGTTRIRNVAHLAHKESDRLAKPAGELRKLGARISFTKDQLVVRGSHLHGGTVSSCGDHRIAMALAVAGLAVEGGVRISGAEATAKSYPRFVADMRSLGANIRIT